MGPPVPKGTHPAREEAVWHDAGRDCGLLRAHFLRQTFPRHSHDCFVVCVNEAGAHSSWYAGSTVVIPDRAITVVPPGEVHTGQPVAGAPWHYRALYPSAELIAELAEEVGLPRGATPSFDGLHHRDTELADAFASTHRRCEEEPDALERETRVAEILMEVLRRHATGARRSAGRHAPSDAVRRALGYINDCYAGPITLDDVAAAAGVSRYAVLRAFRRDLGIAPYALVKQVRVERAKRLLRAGVAISQVSRSTGFADQSHLTRHFRRLTGVTPGVFARASRSASAQPEETTQSLLCAR